LPTCFPGLHRRSSIQPRPVSERSEIAPMTELDQKQLGKTLWNIADTLRGAMNADDFRDYMLSFLFLRYLPDNYEQAAKRPLAAGSGKKAGEFYTPQQISTILSGIVTLDSQEPKTGKRARLESVFDFACGSGSLLLNVRHRMGPHGIGKIFGMEKNITTYNLARMNMLLHGVKDTEF